jgi:hypothetical protein
VNALEVVEERKGRFWKRTVGWLLVPIASEVFKTDRENCDEDVGLNI